MIPEENIWYKKKWMAEKLVNMCIKLNMRNLNIKNNIGNA